MKKTILMTATAAAALAVTLMPIKAEAAQNRTYVKKIISNVNWKDCVINIPCLPGTGLPDIDIPDNTLPDTPENGGPGTDAPEDEIQQSEFAKRVVELVNKEREKAGLKALSIDKKTTAAANVRAREIKQSFSHTRPNGSSFSSALKEQGVSYRGSGENIAWGQKTPEQVMEGWMNSAGHRANILNEKFTSIGVGYYQDASGVNYWTQLFIY